MSFVVSSQSWTLTEWKISIWMCFTSCDGVRFQANYTWSFNKDELYFVIATMKTIHCYFTNYYWISALFDSTGNHTTRFIFPYKIIQINLKWQICFKQSHEPFLDRRQTKYCNISFFSKSGSPSSCTRIYRWTAYAHWKSKVSSNYMPTGHFYVVYLFLLLTIALLCCHGTLVKCTPSTCSRSIKVHCGYFIVLVYYLV